MLPLQVAHLVLSTLNNVARLDLLAAQQLLSSSPHRLELFHLTSFLISYCTNQWPDAADAAPGASAAASSAPPPAAGPSEAPPGAGAPAGPAAGSTPPPAAKASRRRGSSSGSKPSPGSAPQPQPPPPAERPTLLQALAAARQHPIPALLDELLLLLGYFCIANPANQGMLQWGKPPSIMQRLLDMPFAYFLQPALQAVALPTLLSIAYGNHRCCDVIQRCVSIELLLGYVEGQMAAAAQEQAQQQQAAPAEALASCPRPASKPAPGAPPVAAADAAAASAGPLGSFLRQLAGAPPPRFALSQRFPLELLPAARDFLAGCMEEAALGSSSSDLAGLWSTE